MIRLQGSDSGLAEIASLLQNRNRIPDLPNTLYVFGANAERDYVVYISPYIPHAEEAAYFLNNRAKLGGEATVEEIGNPPFKQWVAFHKSLREKRPERCAAVALLLEREIHNLIIW